jgi:hypothetical protein
MLIRSIFEKMTIFGERLRIRIYAPIYFFIYIDKEPIFERIAKGGIFGLGLIVFYFVCGFDGLWIIDNFNNPLIFGDSLELVLWVIFLVLFLVCRSICSFICRIP